MYAQKGVDNQACANTLLHILHGNTFIEQRDKIRHINMQTGQLQAARYVA